MTHNSESFNPKRIERKALGRVLGFGFLGLLLAAGVLFLALMVFPRTVLLTGGESPDWSLLEGFASLLTLSLVIGSIIFATREYMQAEVREARESAESAFNIYVTVYDRMVNERSTAARRWVIQNILVPPRPLTDDAWKSENLPDEMQGWLEECITLLDEAPLDAPGGRGVGRAHLKVVLNDFDFIGFVNDYRLKPVACPWRYGVTG
jgi:hypothetical protein